VEGLTEAQRVYAAKVAARLREAADAEAAAKKARAKRFETGKVLYGVGRYKEAVAALVAALDAEGPFSILGGEIQLWLALAHQAAGDEQACLAVYRQVEAGHPSPKMRKQAADLRYIMEAPKLRVGPDEKPTLPSVDPASPRAPGERTRRRVPPPPRGGGGTARPKTLEERWAEDWTPPALIPNQYVAIAVAAVAAGLAVYSAGVK
jgi:tetratricopeptide (TPR) repeat protein